MCTIRMLLCLIFNAMTRHCYATSQCKAFTRFIWTHVIKSMIYYLFLKLALMCRTDVYIETCYAHSIRREIYTPFGRVFCLALVKCSHCRGCKRMQTIYLYQLGLPQWLWCNAMAIPASINKSQRKVKKAITDHNKHNKTRNTCITQLGSLLLTCVKFNPSIEK